MKEIERFFDNYESPVKIIGEQINSNIENGILKAVHSFGVDVDIEELKKALKYDRNQYLQGYEFGRKEAVKEFAEKLKAKAVQEAEVEDYVCYIVDELLKEYEG